VSDEPKKPFNNPFAALESIKSALPDKPPPPAPPAAPAKGPAKAVVRMERVGRGGKEVTVIEQLEMSLSLKEREKWLKALKGSLGCGGTLEGDNLVLQGDHRERLPELLEKKGVRKVIVG
jgi:translation initiation factor 1